jgi:hypothetical protein
MDFPRAPFTVLLEPNIQPVDRPRFFILADDLQWIFDTSTDRERQRVAGVYGVDIPSRVMPPHIRKFQHEPVVAARWVTDKMLCPDRPLIPPPKGLRWYRPSQVVVASSIGAITI